MTPSCPAEFDVIGYDVPPVVGDYRSMEYGDPNAPRLAQLREEYGLEKVVAGCRSDFAEILALKRWVRGQWDHGFSLNYPKPHDGLGLLQQVAKGEQFCCGSYAVLLRDAATALGLPARIVGLGIRNGGSPRDYNWWNTGHGVTEVWTDTHRKWVTMDPDMNVHYERDGIPLNALELRDAWLDGKAEAVVMVQDQPEFTLPSARQVEIARQDPTCRDDYDEEVNRLIFERFTRHRVLDYYTRVHIAGRTWVDARCLPAFVYHFRPTHNQRWTSNKEEMYWTLNSVRLTAAPAWDAGGSLLTLTLTHCMPFFAHYEAQIDSHGWHRVDESFPWPMREGVNQMECRAVNLRGRCGPASRLTVAHARPPRMG